MNEQAQEFLDPAMLDPRFRESAPPRRVRYTPESLRVRFTLLGAAVLILLTAQGVSWALTGRPGTFIFWPPRLS